MLKNIYREQKTMRSQNAVNYKKKFVQKNYSICRKGGACKFVTKPAESLPEKFSIYIFDFYVD